MVLPTSQSPAAISTRNSHLPTHILSMQNTTAYQSSVVNSCKNLVQTIRSPTLASQTAFEAAKCRLRSNLPKDWLDTQFTISDLSNTVADAQTKYQSRKRSRARQLLSDFSAGVVYYGKIMDTLVSHHAEYVSLAWGTTKFLFVLFENHEELISEFARSFTRVNNILSRLEVHLELHDNPVMLSKIEDLFVAIVDYMHKALRFYQESKLKHALRSFIGPFSVWLAPSVRQIEACSTSITELSILLSQVVHHNTQKAIDLLSQDVAIMQGFLRQALTQLDRQSVDLSDMRVTAMIRASKSDVFDDPDNILETRMRLCRRGPRRNVAEIDSVWSSAPLKRWNADQSIHFLLVQGSVPRRLELNAIGTYMSAYIRKWRVPALFALQTVSHQDTIKTTPQEIYRYLAMQALRLNEDGLYSKLSAAFNARRVESASTEQDWGTIIAHALYGLREVYLVVDLGLLVEQEITCAFAQRLLAGLVRLACACKPTTVKIAILSNRRSRRGAALPANTQVLDLDEVLRKDRRTSLYQAQAATRRARGKGASSFEARLKDKASVAGGK